MNNTRRVKASGLPNTEAMNRSLFHRRGQWNVGGHGVIEGFAHTAPVVEGVGRIVSARFRRNVHCDVGVLGG